MKRFSILFFTLFAVALIFPHRSFASVLTVVPSPGNADTIAITLDTQGENINAVQGQLRFDPALFSVSGIGTGGSIVNFWVQEPTFSNVSGTVDFAGIIPGGINTSQGTIVTITITPKIPGAHGSFAFGSAQILLNDGKGTPSSLTFVGPSFSLGTVSNVVPAADRIIPDVFTPQVGRDPSLFDDAYFVAFSATDQGSGVDHYEILEVPAGGKVVTSSPWVVATSPYLLSDQTLSSDIYVRAVDAAGNFRQEKVSAQNKSGRIASVLDWIELVLGLVVVLLVVIDILRRIRIWRQKRRS